MKIERRKKILSILLCLCLLAQIAPVMVFADAEDGLCAHHSEHTAECGYAQGSEGSACTHEHSEDCYEILECLHTHSDECDDPCTHVCSVDAGCCKLLCSHADGGHDDACGYAASVSGSVCTYHCHICHVQELVDALPGEVTAENAEAVAAQLTAIDKEKASLSDEELAQVDFAKYTAAAEGLGSVYAAVPAVDPTCNCETKCAEDSVNSGCAVCGAVGADLSACTGTETTASGVDDWCVVDTEAGTVTIDGTLGGKETATEDDINALVDQLKAYVDSGNTTIIVTGSKPAMIDMGLYSATAIGEAIYRLSGSDVYDENNPYNGKIDLILSDVTEIVGWEFYAAFALNSITLPKVTKIGDMAFQGCDHLTKLTFGSVLTTIDEHDGLMFWVGEKVDGCDLFLNCGQMNSQYVPDLATNTWTILYKNEFKSITLTHTEATAATCSAKAICAVCEEKYGEVDGNAHSYGDWVSNGDGTHKRTCANDSNHTENDDCSGGTATCKEQAVCDICKTAYGELGGHTPGYSTNGNTITVSCSVNCGYSGTATISATDKTYDGIAVEVIVSKTGSLENTDISVILIKDGEAFSGAPVDAGTYTASITVGSQTVSVEFTIAKAEVSIATAPIPNTLTYMGEAQNLIQQGEAVGGTMVYSLTENGDYTTTIPQGTNSGDYTVWYYVQGNANHNDSAKDSVDVTIERATLTVTSVTAQNRAYDGTTAVTVTGGTISGVVEAENVQLDVSKASGAVTTADAGENKSVLVSGLALKGEDAGNYRLTQPTGVTVTITPKEITVTARDAQIQTGGTPVFAYTVKGLLESDALTKAPAYTTAYTPGSPAGIYAITPSGAEAGSNYTVIHQPGKLFVTNGSIRSQVTTQSVQVTGDLANMSALDTVDEIMAAQNTVLSRITAERFGLPVAGAVHYDVKLQFSLDGVNWIDATQENFPAGGITVLLPYPSGTSGATHAFAVSHIFSVTSERLGTTAGEVETPPVTETAEGLRVTLNGLSPVSIAWVREYMVNVQTDGNGTVTATPASAGKGAAVTVKVTPKFGYRMATLTVTDTAGNPCTVGTSNDDQYYFTMPEGDVTVKVTFTPKSTAVADTTNPKTGDNIFAAMFAMFSTAAAVAVLLMGKKKHT